MRCGRPVSTDDAGRLHERQRSVAAIQDARRIGRSAPRRERHHVGRRRPHAGDLLVAGHRRPAVVTDIGSAMDLFATAAQARRRRAAGRSRHRRRRSAGAADRHRSESARMLFYYSDSELRAVRKGAYKAHFITSGAYGDGESAPSTTRRFCSTSPKIPASITTSPRCTRTSWPISSRKPTAHRKTVRRPSRCSMNC